MAHGMSASNNLGLHVNQYASQLLKTLLVASSSLGTLLYLLNLSGMIANAQWVTLAVFGLVCLGLIVLTAGALLGARFSKPGYAFLAAGYLSLLFVAGVGMLLTRRLVRERADFAGDLAAAGSLLVRQRFAGQLRPPDHVGQQHCSRGDHRSVRGLRAGPGDQAAARHLPACSTGP